MNEQNAIEYKHLLSNANNALEILLIEDNYADQVLFTAYLEKTSCKNAKITTIDRIGKTNELPVNYFPDIIILDLNLPDSEGMVTLRKAQQAFGVTPIIILTGFEDKTMGLKAVSMGAEDYLMKNSLTSEAIEKAITYANQRNRLKESIMSANHRLRITNERLQQFAFIVSHDLNAPLATAKGLLHLVKQTLATTDDEKLVVKAEASIEVLSLKLKKLIEVLVKQKSKENIQQINLAKKVKEVISLTIPKEHADNVHVAIDDTISLSFMPDLLHSILQNLTSNAFKYRHLSREFELNFNVTQKPHYTILSVKDNGSGMDLKDKKDKVFSMFKRIHTHIPGHGIGLYLVKSIMESNNGYIQVESTPNVGTTFELFFPNF